MKHKRNWAIGIILSVTAAFVALQNVAAPVDEPPAPNAGITTIASIAPSPTVVERYGGCGYKWAYQDDPELTTKLDDAVRLLNPAASAKAQQFGEDCVYEDGHSTFLAMETDFYVRLPVEDLTTEEDFGDWMSEVLQIVIKFPQEQIQGKYGFVEFWFEKSVDEHVITRVPIEQYMAEAKEITGAELYRMFVAP